MPKKLSTKVAKPSAPGNPGKPEYVASALRIEKDLYERLRKLAFDTRVPAQTYINRGIAMVLKAQKY